MEQQEIIEIIETQENWDSKDLIKTIKKEGKKRIKVKFCYIAGYECLRDGTQIEECNSLEDVQNVLRDWDIDFDENITNVKKLLDSIEDEWCDKFDDGGGSAWIEVD